MFQIWAKSPQIESATGQQTEGLGVFLIEWSKADSLLKEKRIRGCEMQELISLPIKLWNGISRCFLSINCSNKMLSLRKLKFSAGKYWLCWVAPSPWENLNRASWLPAGKIFANFIFCLKGEKQIDACFPTASRAGRRKERPIALAACLPHSVVTSARWAGRGKQRQGSWRAALQNLPKMLVPVWMNVNLFKTAILKPPGAFLGLVFFWLGWFFWGGFLGVCFFFFKERRMQICSQFFSPIGMYLHSLGWYPHMTANKEVERTITFERSTIPWQLGFHQISNIWLTLDSRRRQNGMVWTYWKSTHKSYSWICNIPAWIANAALKYCLKSNSLDPVHEKLMGNPLLLPSTYLLQWYFHPSPLLPVAWARLVQMNLSWDMYCQFKSWAFQSVPGTVPRAGIPCRHRSCSLSRWEEFGEWWQEKRSIRTESRSKEKVCRARKVFKILHFFSHCTLLQTLPQPSWRRGKGTGWFASYVTADSRRS